MTRVIAVIAALGFLVLATAQGSSLYFITADAKLHQVSQTTGLATLIGTTWPSTTRDLASDTRPGSYRLWTTASTQLLSINPVTGAGTLVGSFNPVSPFQMRTIAFDITNGKLYGTSNELLSKLYDIDTQTGAATLIGPTGLDLGGLAADLSGNLYGVHDGSGIETTSPIYKLDKLTGAPTLVAAPTVRNLSDLAFRPEDGQLWGVADFSLPSGQPSVCVIDLTNGTATRLGTLATSGIPLSLSGLAFGSGTFVPEPGVAGFLLVGAGVMVRRRGRGSEGNSSAQCNR